MAHEEKLALNAEELAEKLGIGRNTAYALLRQKGFPTIRIGKRLIVPTLELNIWLQNQSKEGGTAWKE